MDFSVRHYLAKPVKKNKQDELRSTQHNHNSNKALIPFGGH